MKDEYPLHTAVKSGEISAVIACIESGADIHAKNYWNAKPIDVARDKGYKRIYNLLIEHAEKLKKNKE